MLILIINRMNQLQVKPKMIMIKKRHKHGKLINVSHYSHSNSYTESDNVYGGTTDASTKHHV